ncbi:MAG: phosphoglycerate kinase, partial [Thermoplasmata archaeon]|nr:phosphoglycerate kinase [Thermoplasmata archaeon]
LIGGALANPFLAAAGANLGATTPQAGLETAVSDFLRAAESAHTEVLFPTDVVVDRPGHAEAETYPLDQIPADAVVQDIGPSTRARFIEALGGTKTVFWNGPLGRAEDPRFAEGTRAVLGSLQRIEGYHVAAGGDSARLAQDLGVTGGFQFVSTGGGAALEFVEGLALPGLAVLPDE